MTAQQIEAACREALAREGETALIELNLGRRGHAEIRDDVPLNPHMRSAPLGELVALDDRGLEVGRFFAVEVLDFVTLGRGR